jgi:hypothetical protein
LIISFNSQEYGRRPETCHSSFLIHHSITLAREGKNINRNPASLPAPGSPEGNHAAAVEALTGYRRAGGLFFY